MCLKGNRGVPLKILVMILVRMYKTVKYFGDTNIQHRK